MVARLIANFYLLPFVIGITLLTGCNTFDADFERDNFFDPKSPSFVHTSPAQFSVEVENEVIRVSWIDRTEYNDGYIIEKAINDSTQLTLFTRLPGDAEGFIDDTREIGTATYYRISTYENDGEEEKIVHSELIELSVNVFEDVIITENQNKVFVRWSNSEEFIDGIRIEEKATTATEYSIVKKYEGLGELSARNHFNYSSSEPTFRLDVRLIAYRLQDGLKVDVTVIEGEVEINHITSLSVEYLTEKKARIQWSPSVDFADYYMLKFSNYVTEESIKMTESDTFTFENEFVRGRNHFSVSGISNGVAGRFISSTVNLFIHPPVLENRSISSEVVVLKWDEQLYDSRTKPSLFKIEKKVNDGLYQEIAELPGGQYSYRDYDVDTANEYTYRVRTLLSSPSIELKLSHQNAYTETDNNTVVLARNSYRWPVFKFFGGDMLAMHSNFGVRYPIHFINKTSLQKVSSFDSGNDALFVDLHTEEMKVAEFTEGNVFGRYELNIWDIKTSALEMSIKDAHINTEATFVNPEVEWSADGNFIASGTRIINGEVKIWDTKTGDHLHTFNTPNEQLINFRFNPLANEIIVVSRQKVTIYNLDTFEKRVQFTYSRLFGSWVKPVVLEKSNSVLIPVEGDLAKFDLNSGDLLNERQFNDRFGNHTEITHISVNREHTQIGVQLESRTEILDSGNFDIIQTLYWDQPFGQNYLTLDATESNSAISFIRSEDKDFEWDVKKLERRNNWFAQPTE